MFEDGRAEKFPQPVKAESIMNLKQYSELPERAHVIQLVSSVEHMVSLEGLKEPRLVEIGPVPTFHYEPSRFGIGEYIADAKEKYVSKSDIPPITYIADRHPDWHFAAISPHDIPSKEKTRLMRGHDDMYVYELGPERKRGINYEDVWDEDYMRGKSIMEKYYGGLLEKLGGPPDIIFARHVFDFEAQYPAGKLVTVAAMMLKPGGLLLSEVHLSGPHHSHVPLATNFPFDTEKNLKHVLTVKFPRSIDRFDDHVFIYRKTGDAIRPEHLDFMEKRKAAKKKDD